MELKLKVDDLSTIKAKLIACSAEFITAETTKHVYFNQDQTSSLIRKLVYQENSSVFYAELEKVNDRFVFRTRKKVAHPDSLLSNLADTYGVKRRLTMHAEKYLLNSNVFGLYTIKGVGKFVIIEGDNPSLAIARKVLEIDHPNIVTDSFDNL